MKKILPALLSLIIVAFSQGAYAQGGVLPLNGSVSGNLTSATPDVYTVTTTSDGLLRLTFTTVSPADLYVTLYDNDGTTALSAQTESFNNSTAVVTVDGLATGTYKVKIIPFSTDYGAYTLADSLFTTPLANDVEPNGSVAAASVLGQNGSKTGHVGYYYNNLRDTTDWYKVTTTSDGLLRVYLTTDSGSIYSTTGTNPLDVNLTLYDNDGTTQLGAVEVFSGYKGTMGVITADGLAPGTYYIKIQPFSTNEFANYKITDSLFKAPLANDAEPNGTAATALTLPLNSSNTGNVGYYYNNFRDTTDWYKVTTTSNGLLRVYLTTDSGSIYSTTSTNPLDVNVTLYDNNGTTQLGSVEVFSGYVGATGVITEDGLAPGTYYIKVQPFSVNEFANYKITDSLFTATLANDAEPNGTAATAVTLPLNSSKNGNVGYYYNNFRDTTDWYKVTTTSDGLLRIYLTTDSGSIYSTTSTNPLDVNVTLYDNDGTTQLGFVEPFNGNKAATGVITEDGLAPGTYYIKVQPFSVNEFANYKITDSLFTATLANDAEPNGTAATALTLPLNSSKTGNVGYYYNRLRDTTDWYKVTTNGDGLLRLYVSTDSGSIQSNTSTNPLDLNVYLYDNDGTTQLGYAEVYSGYARATNLISTDGLAAGTYYIKVQPYSTSQFANYKITDSLFVSSVKNDSEYNGTTATALIFPPGSTAKGHVGYYYNNLRDTSDWYKLTTTTAGPLYLYLSSLWGNQYNNNSNNPLDMELYLYSSDGTTLLGSKEVYNGYNPAVDSLYLPDLAAGTYYVKVTNFSTTQFANYSLTNSAMAGGLLPVTFLNFDGVLENGKALLSWRTATELNNKGFKVERSYDGRTFAGIGFVPGHGNASLVNDYNYTDIKVQSGYNFYRLKQMDIDGNINYSSTIRLDFKNFAWSVLGNPVTANSWVQVQLAKSSKVALQIITSDGRVLQTINKGSLSAGTYSIPLSLGNVASGIYVVRLIVDNTSFSKMVVK